MNPPLRLMDVDPDRIAVGTRLYNNVYHTIGTVSAIHSIHPTLGAHITVDFPDDYHYTGLSKQYGFLAVLFVIDGLRDR